MPAAPSLNSAHVPRAGSPPPLPAWQPPVCPGLAWSLPSLTGFFSQFPRVSCLPTRQQTPLSLGLFSSLSPPEDQGEAGPGGAQQVRRAGGQHWLIDSAPCAVRG